MGVEKFAHGQFSQDEHLSDVYKNIGNENLRIEEASTKLNELLREALSPRYGAGSPQPKDEELFKSKYGVDLSWATRWARENKKGISSADRADLVKLLMSKSSEANKVVN